jgi:hypothetical protein
MHVGRALLPVWVATGKSARPTVWLREMLRFRRFRRLRVARRAVFSVRTLAD